MSSSCSIASGHAPARSKAERRHLSIGDAVCQHCTPKFGSAVQNHDVTCEEVVRVMRCNWGLFTECFTPRAPQAPSERMDVNKMCETQPPARVSD